MSEEHVYSIVPRINGVTLTFGSLPDGVTRQGAITFNVAGTASFERLLKMMNLQVLLSFQRQEGNGAAQESGQASGTQALQEEEAEKNSKVRLFPFLGNRQENLKLTAAIIKHCTRYKKELAFELPGFIACIRKWRYCRYYFSSVPTVLLEVMNIPKNEEEQFCLQIYQVLMECYGMNLSAERVELFKREIHNVKTDEQNGVKKKISAPAGESEPAQAAPAGYSGQLPEQEVTGATAEGFEQNQAIFRQDDAAGPDQAQELAQEEGWADRPCGQTEADAGEKQISERVSEQDSEQVSQQEDNILDSERDSEQNSEKVREDDGEIDVNATKVTPRVRNKIAGSRAKQAKTKGKGQINLQSLFLPPDGPLFQFTATTPAENLKYPLPPPLDRDSVVPFNVSCRGKECGCGAVAEKDAHSKPEEESTPGVKFIPVEREDVKLPSISS